MSWQKLYGNYYVKIIAPYGLDVLMLSAFVSFRNYLQYSTQLWSWDLQDAATV